MIKLPTSRIGWRTLLIAGAVISNFLTIDGAVTDGRLGYATDVPFSHRLCNQGMYTGQVMFRRSGSIVPDGNGTFTCLTRMTNERVERSGRSPLSSDGGDGAPAFIYSGGWDQGVRKGMGVTSFGNGDEFRGRYQGDVRNGHGEMNWHTIEGDRFGRRYVGDFTDGRKHGKGQMRFPNGDVYTGDWVQGKRTGKGLYLFHQSGNRYKGDYLNGIKQGKGIFWWTTGPHAGERYEGDFMHDRRNGLGVYWFANGDVYEGHWINGKRHGQGQMMFEADGNILNGTWFEGVRHGDFELSNTEEGTSFQMSYEMGRRQTLSAVTPAPTTAQIVTSSTVAPES